MKKILTVILSILFLPAFAQFTRPNTNIKTNWGSIFRLFKFPSSYVPIRDIDVWLPEGYDTSDFRYPVIYMQDGEMLFDSTKTWNGQEWKVDETMKSLITKNKIENCIIVGIPSAKNLRRNEYFPANITSYLPKQLSKEFLALRNDTTDANKYLLFISKELKPFIDNSYRTMSAPQFTCLAGASMGGLLSWYGVCEYSMTFGKAICLSTHWPGINPTDSNSKYYAQAFEKYLQTHLPEPNEAKFYFAHGGLTLDKYYTPYQKKVNSLFAKKKFNKSNFKFMYYPNDEHNEISWAKQLPFALEFMFGKKVK